MEKHIKKVNCTYNNKKYICVFPEYVKSKLIKKENPTGYFYPTLWTFEYEFKKYFDKFKVLEKTKNIDNKFFVINKFILPINIKELLEKHYKPPNIFIEYVLKLSNEHFIKITQNDMILFKSLLDGGGNTKNFKTKEKKYTYSEYMGNIQINKDEMNYINITAKRDILNTDDIYLPRLDIVESSKYKVIFHTHPPRTHPGARAAYGIIYEFPSPNDIIQIFKLYNKRNITKSSLIVASEGLYEIRMIKNKHTNITEELIKSVNNIMYEVINDAFDKYCDIFDIEYFYNVITTDFTFIERINTKLSEYNLQIKYYPTQKNLFIDAQKYIFGSIYVFI